MQNLYWYIYLLDYYYLFKWKRNKTECMYWTHCHAMMSMLKLCCERFSQMFAIAEFWMLGECPSPRDLSVVSSSNAHKQNLALINCVFVSKLSGKSTTDLFTIIRVSIDWIELNNKERPMELIWSKMELFCNHLSSQIGGASVHTSIDQCEYQQSYYLYYISITDLQHKRKLNCLLLLK